MPARTLGRIRTRAAFDQLQRSRARARCGPVRATFVAADPGLPGVFPQVGYTIGKRCGNAVVRNRTRRRLKEAARLLLAQRPVAGVDLVLIGRDSTRKRNFIALQGDIRRALERTGV